MKVLFLVCLLGVLAAPALADNQLSWIGVWEDVLAPDFFGGNLNTCVVNNTIHGTYSEIGYIVGTLSGRQATGTWHEAGYTDSVSGGFLWQLDSDNSNFKGYWWYDFAPCVQFTWQAKRKNGLSSADQCYPIATDSANTLAGYWQSGVEDFGLDNMYICLNNDINATFVASYDLDPKGIHAFVWGRTFEGGRAAAGTYYDNIPGEEGIGLIKMTGPNEMVTFQYNVQNVDLASNSYNSPNIKRKTIVWTRQGKASNSQCRTYQNQSLSVQFDGSWTDSRTGGRLHICTAGGAGWGVYGEAGYLDGTVNGSVFQGRFYDAGNCNRCQGNFKISLDADRQTFTGTYQYDVDAQATTWRETRVDVSEIAAGGCYPLAGGSSTLAGRWNLLTNANDVFDICLYPLTNDTNQGIFEGSFTINGVDGYSEGVWNQDGQGAQLNFVVPEVGGVSTMRLTGPNQLTHFIWGLPHGKSSRVYNYPCFNSSSVNTEYFTYHQVVQMVYQKSTTQKLCKRNQNVKLDPNFGQDSSSAGKLFVSSLLSLLSAVVAAWMFL